MNVVERPGALKMQPKPPTRPPNHQAGPIGFPWRECQAPGEIPGRPSTTQSRFLAPAAPATLGPNEGYLFGKHPELFSLRAVSRDGWPSGQRRLSPNSPLSPRSTPGTPGRVTLKPMEGTTPLAPKTSQPPRKAKREKSSKASAQVEIMEAGGILTRAAVWRGLGLDFLKDSPEGTDEYGCRVLERLEQQVAAAP